MDASLYICRAWGDADQPKRDGREFAFAARSVDA
jgi:hypothetical protein